MASSLSGFVNNLQGGAARSAAERLPVVLVQLLTAVDALDRWLSVHASSDAEAIALVRRQLGDLLAREQVTRLETVGRRFDPARHEALGTRADAHAVAGVIVEEVVAGYIWPAGVLRYAQVFVSSGRAD